LPERFTVGASDPMDGSAVTFRLPEFQAPVPVRKTFGRNSAAAAWKFARLAFCAA
jgi:hypothetical protein